MSVFRHCLATSSFERSFSQNGGVQLLILSLNSVCWDALAHIRHCCGCLLLVFSTRASVIFHTSSNSDFTLCFLNLINENLVLLFWTTLTIGKHLPALSEIARQSFSVLLGQVLSSLGRSSNLLTAISYQRLCLLLALLLCLQLALLFLHGFLVFDPGSFALSCLSV